MGLKVHANWAPKIHEIFCHSSIISNLLQMLIRINTSTWIPRVYDNHSHSILISKSFNSIKIDLPPVFWKQIKMACFKVNVSTTSFIVWETRPWQQYIGSWTRKDSECNFNCLRTPKCQENIVF